jgi:hypothetical protein
MKAKEIRHKQRIEKCDKIEEKKDKSEQEEYIKFLEQEFAKKSGNRTFRIEVFKLITGKLFRLEDELRELREIQSNLYYKVLSEECAREAKKIQEEMDRMREERIRIYCDFKRELERENHE